ncbi:MAG: ATP-binding protein [bacterium]|nr:ATP-binding protein [bacterium]
MGTNIIGRHKELTQFTALMKSKQSEFVAVYGRRRVGKTFLIRETFSNTFSFQLTGLANANLAQQLVNFSAAINNYYPTNKIWPIPKTWFEAFQQLIGLLEKTKQSKKIIFLDELPWLDTPRSNFIQALEHFWNSWASARKDILLIVCGSAASWMLNVLINNKGGLHNRITCKMKIVPFTLAESELYFQSKGIKWNRYQILENYMVMGGIPFYMNAVKKGKSATQAINELCFDEDGLLTSEFENLYASLFRQSANHILVVKALSKKAKGLSREEIISYAKIPNGGGTSKVLMELELSGFIRTYVPFGKQTKDTLYQLIDFYTLFYFKFLHDRKYNDSRLWLNLQDTPLHRNWAGYAFEMVAMQHVSQLKLALGISGVQSNIASWRYHDSDAGAQIDLLIDRRDQVITICEMKFSINEFVIDKSYAAKLRNKIGSFKRVSKTKSAIQLCMLTTYGVSANNYSLDLVQNDLSMDCLFSITR